MSDQLSKLSEMHDLVIDQVLEDLQNGDRRARQEAMALLKNSNVTAVAAELSVPGRVIAGFTTSVAGGIRNPLHQRQ